MTTNVKVLWLVAIVILKAKDIINKGYSFVSVGAEIPDCIVPLN